MRNTRTARTTRRTWAVRCLTLAGAAGLVLAGVTPSVAAAAGTTHSGTTGGKTTWVVKKGQSIQAAADNPLVHSGDTIKIEAGTYKESVCIINKALTIKGAGSDKTIISYDKDVPVITNEPDRCWKPGTPEGQTTENVSALKFYYPDGPVTVTDLQTQGHPESGIDVWGAKGLTVERTKGVGHGVYGILATAGSTKILISDNVEKGIDGPYGPGSYRPAGTAGISVGDSANARAVITNNRSEGEHLGIFVRESRGGIISNNTVSHNCVGILVFDDSSTEKPDFDHNVIGGDWSVLANRSSANNGYCIAGRQGNQHVSGVGMSVVNADHVSVSGNIITDNHPVPPGGQPVDFFPSGLSVLTLPAMPEGSTDPGPAEYVRVIGNIFKNNQPLDIHLFSPPGVPPGSGNVFRLNLCKTSDPASICSK